VFANRDRPDISPLDAVAKLLDAGHGAHFDESVRSARVLTWVKQVFRRLRKHGWLQSRTSAEWQPTEALRCCRNGQLLARKAPRHLIAQEPPKREELSPVESWPAFVERWVFEHRDSIFGIGEVVAAMVQRGFGTGPTEARLNAAREVAEEELRLLAREYIVEQEDDVWRATDLLENWPSD
jgi:hypothetical protein